MNKKDNNIQPKPTPNKKAPKTGRKTYGIKNMGLNIDKNEYMEIILSNSNHPESAYSRKKDFY